VRRSGEHAFRLARCCIGLTQMMAAMRRHLTFNSARSSVQSDSQRGVIERL
jgi:hypothetical protein